MKFKVLFCLLIAAPFAVASSEFISIQEKGQAQSLTGASLLNDAVYSNPASMSFSQVYSVEGTWSMPRSFSASVIDTKTAGVGAGFGYFRKTLDTPNNILQGLRLAVAGKANQFIGVGTTGKYLWGPNGNKLIDVDPGMLMNLEPVQIGTVIRNLFGGSGALGQQREVAIGGRIGYKETVYLNTTITAPFRSFNPNQFAVGAEYDSPYYFGLKGGYRYVSDVRQSFWAAGFSINSPKVSVHYAVEFPMQGSVGPEHMLGTNIQF